MAIVNGIKVANTPEAIGLALRETMPPVSRMQIRVALMRGRRLAGAEGAAGKADALTRLAWAEAGEFRRDSSAIAALAAALGLTDAQVDDLFMAAAAITD